MSTFTDTNGLKTTPLDGPNDLKPEVKTTLVQQREKPVVVKKEKKKETTKSE